VKISCSIFDPGFQKCSFHFKKLPYHKTDNNNIELCKTFFGIYFDYSTLNPKFSFHRAEYLKISKLLGGRHHFMYDKDLKSQYNMTIFSENIDKGHLTPSYIMSYNKDNDGPWYNTYLMSNIAGQYSIFNQRCWASLEKFIVNFILESKKDFYIVTLTSNKKIKISWDFLIPEYFIKIVLDLDGNYVSGFYGKNENIYSDSCLEKRSLDEVEKIFGEKILF
jgi:DNA/RNA endonuclease G (NUC1)